MAGLENWAFSTQVKNTGLAQLVEHWSPKPGVGSSSLSTRARNELTPIKMVDYLKESYSELRNHVSWPTWAEAQRLTVIVAIFSIVLALAVFGVDRVFSGVIELYFNWIKS